MSIAVQIIKRISMLRLLNNLIIQQNVYKGKKYHVKGIPKGCKKYFSFFAGTEAPENPLFILR